MSDAPEHDELQQLARQSHRLDARVDAMAADLNDLAARTAAAEEHRQVLPAQLESLGSSLNDIRIRLGAVGDLTGRVAHLEELVSSVLEASRSATPSPVGDAISQVADRMSAIERITAPIAGTIARLLETSESRTAADVALADRLEALEARLATDLDAQRHVLEAKLNSIGTAAGGPVPGLQAMQDGIAAIAGAIEPLTAGVQEAQRAAADAASSSEAIARSVEQRLLETTATGPDVPAQLSAAIERVSAVVRTELVSGRQSTTAAMDRIAADLETVLVEQISALTVAFLGELDRRDADPVAPPFEEFYEALAANADLMNNAAEVVQAQAEQESRQDAVEDTLRNVWGRLDNVSETLAGVSELTIWFGDELGQLRAQLTGLVQDELASAGRDLDARVIESLAQNAEQMTEMADAVTDALAHMVRSAQDSPAPAVDAAVVATVREALEMAARANRDALETSALANRDALETSVRANREAIADAINEATGVLQAQSSAAAEALVAELTAMDVSADRAGLDAEAVAAAIREAIQDGVQKAMDATLEPVLRSAERSFTEAAARAVPATPAPGTASDPDTVAQAVFELVAEAIEEGVSNLELLVREAVPGAGVRRPPEGQELTTAMISAVAAALDEFGERVDRDLDRMGERLAAVAGVLERTITAVEEIAGRRRGSLGDTFELLRQIAGETTQDVSETNQETNQEPNTRRRTSRAAVTE